MKNNKTMIVSAVIVLTVGVLAFFGGMKHQEGKTGSGNSNRQFAGGVGNRTGGQNGQGRFGAGRPVTGEIISTDDKSITVKMQDGTSKIVLLSASTSINKASEGTKEDLKVGTRVLASGTENTDGSLSAVNIQLNPTFRGMGDRQISPSAKSTNAKEIIVEGSNYNFLPNTITVKKGVKTRILFKNSGGMHDFKVDELNIATRVIQGGEEDSVEFTADKTGQYEFYCSIGSHRQMGMKGTLVVE